MCEIDKDWFVQESPSLNPDCFGDTRCFSEKKKKRKAHSYKVTVQTLHRKPVEGKLDNFINYLSPFLNVGTFAFFHLEGNLPERKQF